MNRSLLVALLVAVVNGALAARQVPLPSPPAPSPPPPGAPSAPASTYNAPGIQFSIDVAGYIEGSFGSTQRSMFCANLVNATRPYSSTCSINLVETASSAYPGVVNVEGILNYNLYDPDPNTVFAATASRDVLVQALTNNATAVLAPMIATKNCDCLGPNVAPTINQPTAYSYASPNGRNITSMANALCAARLSYTSTQTAGDVIGVNNGLANTADKFKYCSNPAIVGGTTGTPGTSPCVSYGVTNAYTSTATTGATATGEIVVANGQLSSVSVTTGGAGYTSSQQTAISLTVSASAQATLAAPATNCKIATLVGAAVPYTVTLDDGTSGTCNFNAGAGYNKAAPGTFAMAAGTWTLTGCGIPASLIGANDGKSGAGDVSQTVSSLGSLNIVCTGSTGAPDATGTPDVTISAISVFPATVAPTVTPVIQGGQISALPVTSAGAAYGQVTLPTLPTPASTSTGQLCTNAGNIPGADPTKFILQATGAPGATGTCLFIGADSGAQAACGTPVPPGGVVGIPGKGSCSVQNAWIPQCNGGMDSCPSSATYTCGVLPQSFITNRGPAPPAPAPAPTPTPTPTPAKAPTPTPTPTPKPSPTPLVCTYRGTYKIRPLYAPCDKYYLASGTKSNCAENFVHLRTKSNLGGKYERVRWAIAATAANGLGTPTRVVAEARAGVGACTNRNLAAPSDPTKGLKVGGSSWQWQFVPYPGSDKCDTVNMISQNRLSTTAFLSVPRTCKTFAYNATDGGRQRFRLTKV